MEQIEAEANTPGFDGSLLQAGTLGERTFCIETHGVQGNLAHVLAPLSASTETLSVLTTAKGMDHFEYWRDGQRIEAFEPGSDEPDTAASAAGFHAAFRRRSAVDPERPDLLVALETVSDYLGGLVVAEERVEEPLLAASIPFRLPAGGTSGTDDDAAPDPPLGDPIWTWTPRG